MANIVQAVNAMLAKPDSITDVVEGPPGTYFFAYKGRHHFSVGTSYDDQNEATSYWVRYHADDRSPEDICNSFEEYPGKFVVYSTRALNTREALESFENLYTLAREKLYGVDTALNDIVDPPKDALDDIPF